MRIKHRSMHPQTRAACRISLYRKHLKSDTKKKKKEGEWIKGTATKQHVDVLAEVQHRRSKKPQQHWGTSWMCFHLELGLSWQLSSSSVLSRKVLTIYTGRGFSKRKGTSFIEVELCIT